MQGQEIRHSMENVVEFQNKRHYDHIKENKEMISLQKLYTNLTENDEITEIQITKTGHLRWSDLFK